MTSDANRRAIAQLAELELVTPTQRDAALAAPDLDTTPELPSPHHALGWMLLRSLTTEDELEAALDKLYGRISEDAHDERYAIIDDALDLLELAEMGVTREAVLALYDDTLIDATLRDELLTQVPYGAPQQPLPAATLAWLVDEHFWTEEDFEALRQRVDAEPPFVDAMARKELMAEAARIVKSNAEERARVMASFRAGGRSGSWFWKLVGVAIIAGGAWYLTRTPSVTPSPAAGAEAVTEATVETAAPVAVEASEAMDAAIEASAAADAAVPADAAVAAPPPELSPPRLSPAPPPTRGR